jgi:excisionase family DNA binding protein
MKRGRPKRDDREQPPPAGDVMTLNEVAEYLDCSKGTIYRLLKRGEFPAFRLGSDFRFRRENIDKWIAQLQEQQKVPQPGETAASKQDRRGQPRQRRDSLRD